MHTEATTALSEWLARAQDGPDHARAEWKTSGVALLPLGRRFDAVRMPEPLVHAALDTQFLTEAAEGLARRLLGPVIYDGRTMGGTYYALMQPYAARYWPHDDKAPWLGLGTYLGVPRLDRTEPPGTHWVVPPQAVGRLCPVALVGQLVAAGWYAMQAGGA
ncbi:hypothetical protein DCW30_05965 [Streptomyces alfalfae]|uniref:hypothetical protein n=1 Tax=Streptomyces alfalfae TaxID=1642299 RepID=UPI0009A17BD0|nr:hypothetical protein [Streptomyces alfalfae]AYA18550.1 hypothetical protein D3X13_22020 [Streptomyces fradiae]RXX46569.1 hypothetical protein DCW30_05965 [Streptomyces alfalfae]RZM90082.1 hypothetical protein D4104_25900 [Streptomyces alfalfae]